MSYRVTTSAIISFPGSSRMGVEGTRFGSSSQLVVGILSRDALTFENRGTCGCWLAEWGLTAAI